VGETAGQGIEGVQNWESMVNAPECLAAVFSNLKFQISNFKFGRPRALNFSHIYGLPAVEAP
jgi:hypothetical protein